MFADQELSSLVMLVNFVCNFLIYQNAVVFALILALVLQLAMLLV
jgi:hypothetical protein